MLCDRQWVGYSSKYRIVRDPETTLGHAGGHRRNTKAAFDHVSFSGRRACKTLKDRMPSNFQLRTLYGKQDY